MLPEQAAGIVVKDLNGTVKEITSSFRMAIILQQEQMQKGGQPSFSGSFCSCLSDLLNADVAEDKLPNCPSSHGRKVRPMIINDNMQANSFKVVFC